MPEPTTRFVARLARLPATALIALVRVYQRTLSPVLPVVLGPGCGCRFTPTCSHYAIGALRDHGAVAGLGLAAVRLLKCTPLHPGGEDPVPAPRARPRCHAPARLASAPPSSLS
jgi:hypothetical protein